MQFHFYLQFETEIAKLINTIVTSEFNSHSIYKLNDYICEQLGTLNAHVETGVFVRIFTIFRQRILQTFLNVLQGEVEVFEINEDPSVSLNGSYFNAYVITEKAPTCVLPPVGRAARSDRQLLPLT